MKRLLWILTLGFMVLLTSLSAGDKPQAMIIFDASGSMWGQIDGKAKITIARDALKDVVKGWNENIELGLTVYGHRKKGDCSDIETVIPIGKVNKSNMISKVSKIMPKGKTPIAKSLRQVADKLRGNEDETTIILISDGKESCDADPCSTAKQLKAEGIKFVAHVVGFNVDKSTDKQLQCIADATGGEYFSAKNATALNKAIKSITKKVEKPKPKVKKLDHNIEVTASETDGGKWVRASHYIYEDEGGKAGERAGYVSSSKKKVGKDTLPVGKYILKSSYNDFEKLTPFEIKAGKVTKIHVIFSPFFISAKCTDANAKVTYEVYASNGQMVDDKKIKCSDTWKITLDDGDYSVEATIEAGKGEAKFTVGVGKPNKLILDLINLNHEEEIKADSAEKAVVVPVTVKKVESKKEQKQQTHTENVKINGLDQKDLEEAGKALNALGALFGSVTKEQQSKNQESDKKADKEFEEMSKSLDMFSK